MRRFLWVAMVVVFGFHVPAYGAFSTILGSDPTGTFSWVGTYNISGSGLNSIIDVMFSTTLELDHVARFVQTHPTDDHKLLFELTATANRNSAARELIDTTFTPDPEPTLPTGVTLLETHNARHQYVGAELRNLAQFQVRMGHGTMQGFEQPQVSDFTNAFGVEQRMASVSFVVNTTDATNVIDQVIYRVVPTPEPGTSMLVIVAGMIGLGKRYRFL